VSVSAKVSAATLIADKCLPLEGWVLISEDKVYTPTSADVGCKLRIVVKAVALGDGEVLAGPISIFTEAVLQAPRAPPKRVRPGRVQLRNVRLTCCCRCVATELGGDTRCYGGRGSRRN
jgi:hypothetical protein